MSDTTLETPHSLGPEGHDSSPPSRSGSGGRALLERYVWWLVGLGVVLAAAIALRWANTRPGYDPYGWLDWGYHTWHGTLNLGGAPSWKPFTFVFTVVYAIFGHWSLYLWMLTAVSISFSGAVFGARIAYRMTANEGGAGRGNFAAWGAALFAGAAVLGIQDYFHYLMSAQSDSMLVAVCLAAIDMYLSGRLRWAFWLGVLAGWGRPEVWPFLAVYGIFLWRKHPNMRKDVVGGAVITLFLWFGVPTITNGRPNIAGQLALRSPRECTTGKITCTISRFTALDYFALELAALLVLGLALLRRNWTVVTLAVMAAGWVVVEIAFVLHGFPGVPRYLFEPAGLTAVLAGICFGWLLLDAKRYWRALPSWAGIPVAVVLFAVMVPKGIANARAEHKDIYHERERTTEINKLGATIAALGGPGKVQACGWPVLNVEYVSIMGWYLHRNTGVIGYRPKIELAKKRPDVYFLSLPNGWKVTGNHQPAGSVCAKSMNALYVPTARHPEGVLVPK
ncbi:MAG TPA: hypothetical protein VMF14_19430 [Solirubrobacteraceae bacterium]|nr:hypothetical protein [Solirubrobacteraceae bacterium]